MSDKFFPQNLLSLLDEILTQLNSKDEILGLPFNQIFNPNLFPNLKMNRYGQQMATPYGLAAGPHTQLSRNIVAGWLMGARYIELKTIQTLDELDVKKPCIDMQDEGYNCEWSQELKIKQSFDEYLNAWIIIHIINYKMGWGNHVETIFNMSVGYDMEGVLKENVQWYFSKMADCSVELEEKKDQIRSMFPQIDDLNIPSSISNNITLSTMHGCPPDEVEQISEYLISEKKLHTTVKLNPTLLGGEKLRFILNDTLNYPVDVPDEAFNHDIKYTDAVSLINNLWKLSLENGLHFAIKLTNTLEVNNTKGILPEEMVYMSGRALHPIAINLATKLQKEFQGKLDISFSAGADAFNLVSIAKCGLFPVTVSSDLLKPGGYGRLLQYYTSLSEGFNNQENFQKGDSTIQGVQAAFLQNYAVDVLKDSRYKYMIFESKNIKSDRPLGSFDCIAAPCMDACPTEQDIPDYLYWASKGDFDKALDVIYQKNPLPRTLGLVCEHGCQTKCTRVNYDSSLRIRDIKEFIATHGNSSNVSAKPFNGLKVAIIGAGPSGLSAAWFLALEGFKVEIFEKSDRAGGMPQSVIPEFRLSSEALQNDIDRILSIGALIHYNHPIGRDEMEKLTNDFNYVYMAGGAEKSKLMRIPGENSPVTIDPLKFLRDYKAGKAQDLGEEVLVIGGGNTAMDVARAVKRFQNGKGSVSIVYRRTMQQMPAEPQEIKDAIDEGIQILELLSPLEIIDNNGVYSLRLQKMRISESVGKDGRKKVEPIADNFVELNVDCVIPAIGQDSQLPFDDFNDIQSLNTADLKLKVYAGGDATRGASSIVQAVGDGRFFAEHILRIEKLEQANNNIDKVIKKDKQTHLEQRFIRVESFYPSELSNITEEQAIEEASRCIQCDEHCNACVSVCPNRANQYYNVQPQTFQYQNIIVKGKTFSLTDDLSVHISQDSQIYNIGDFCNECGNCSTFCPTAGDPYKDKPQIHLSESSFNSAERGYFQKEDSILVKSANMVSQLKDIAGKLYYQNDRVEVVLAKESLKILDVFIKQEGDYLEDLYPIIEVKLLKDSRVF